MRYLVEPWKHQLEAIERAKDMPGYALFFEMGAGKSGTAVNILRHKFMKHGRILRTLVLCPPAVRTNWKREFAMHAAKKVADSVVVLEGSGKKRCEVLEKHGFDQVFGPLPKDKIFVTNYESLGMKDLWKLLKDWAPEAIIYDESQRCKNYKAKRTKLAIEIADQARYKYILSGTPILNTPMDIWSQYRILDGGETFDRNFFAFRAKYFVDQNAGMPSAKYFPAWRPAPGLADVFNDKIYAKASRVLKKDCMDLPPIVRKRYEIDMVPDQEKLYKDMAKSYVAYLNDKACVASIALTKGLRLQQIASGYFRDDQEKDHEFKTNPRLVTLMDILADVTPDHKVIVWASFKKNYQQIFDALKAKGLEATSLVGGMKDNERQESIDKFQTDPKCRIMVSNAASGGVGINLTAASYMIYYSRSFNLEHDLQSEARCHRGGSERHESITRIDLVTKDSIDDIVLTALARKENLANNILKLKDLL